MREKIGDTALKAKTGKTWAEWFTVLDSAEADQMNHTQIAAHLHDRLNVTGWWSQMVAVGYEQAMGLRVKHETAAGFKITVSRIIPAPIADVYRAFINTRQRAQWLPGESVQITTTTANKSIRALWSDGVTRLSIDFSGAGKSRSRVAVEHQKLTDSRAA